MTTSWCDSRCTWHLLRSAARYRYGSLMSLPSRKKSVDSTSLIVSIVKGLALRMASNLPYDRKAQTRRIEELAMATAALATTDTRTRLIEVAVDLFTRHSFAGTSLQMIAAELGFTKAAIYHHFRTREQLLAAVLEPMLDALRTVVESAETRRTPHARAEYTLSGYAE